MTTDSHGTISDFQNYLLENEGSPQLDVVLGELLRQSEREVVSRRDAEEAASMFSGFVEKTGLRSAGRFRRAARIAVNIAAAMLPLALSVCLWLALGPSGDEQPVWSEISTSTSESASVLLSDGTSVRLGPCSRITYPDRFTSSERKVFVSGDILFDVAKDPECGFVAVAGEIDILVHGTKFHLSSFIGSDSDELALMEGAVELKADSAGGAVSVSLVPGDMVRYDRKSGSISRLRFDVNNYNRVLESGGLQFIDASLSEIAASLSRRFGVGISVDGSIAGERFWASFINGESLDEMLESLNVERSFRIYHDNDNNIKLMKR